MIHCGDITKISGYSVPITDAVIGGSPCQDLSIAGRRAGLSGERSGLFAEQIRIIKEMREVDKRNGRTGQLIRPRFMVWENVPGAFSSHGGEDFRTVLEETIRIAEPEICVPGPSGGKWPTAGAVVGDGYSVAWRVLDAQYWGVPQRRRRIALVADFGGHAAPEILFVRESLRGNIEPGETAREEDSAGTGSGAYPAIARSLTARYDGSPCIDRGPNIVIRTNENGGQGKTVYCIQGNCVDRDARQNGAGITKDVAYTLNAVDRHCVAVYENHGQDSRLTGPLDVAPTVSQKFGTGGNNTPLVLCSAFAIGRDNTTVTDGKSHTLTSKDTQGCVARMYTMATGQANAEILEGVCPTLNCDHEAPIAGIDGCVWRMTPLECERLQGYPDGWTDIGAWTDSKGKRHRESSDSARYRALGNSIALPPWKWVLKRICAYYERDATMASLFDGIGGFPLIWERLNGKGTCLWCSEIEEFATAVTKYRFNDNQESKKEDEPCD